MAFKLHSFRKTIKTFAKKSSRNLDIHRGQGNETIDNDGEELDSRKSSDRSDFFVTSECKRGPLFTKIDDTVILTSPIFGSRIKISNVKVKFGTSKAALRDLKNVENQIKQLKSMPDFGYGEDNYILRKSNSKGWAPFLGLLDERKRFEHLMNHIQL